MLKANFYGNVHFRPEYSYVPQSKPEVYEILRVHRADKIRVVGSGHSWSDVAASSSVMISLAKLNQVEAIHVGDDPWVRVQGGCRLKDLVKELQRKGLTLPSIGQVTEQTVAGTISTATHGSGNPSMSHFVIGLEVAAYDTNGHPARYRWDQNDSGLGAACCGLGCMGVVLAVTLRCVPAYFVCELGEIANALDDVLAVEADYPLQEFGLIPYTWKYFIFRRRRTEHRPWWRIPHAWWNRATKLLLADIGFHTQLKTVLRFGGSGRWLMRSVPIQLKVVKLISLQGVVVDDSVAVLTRAHHLFRHLEMEIFVPADTVRDAVKTIQYITAVFAGSPDGDAAVRERIASEGQYERLCDLHGSYVPEARSGCGGP